MNTSQIHLALNHVPLFLSIVGGLILLYGFIKRADPLKFLSLYFMIAAALFIIPVYLTGEGAEEVVEGLPGISESLIEKHEETARVGSIVTMIAGIVSLSTLVIRKNPALLKLSLVLCAFLSFISFGIMGQTAHLGGQIRHYELRHGAASPTENKNGNSEVDETKKEAKDDD